jgi:hypothetical protein
MDKSEAVQLFEDGRALLEQGRVDQACPKLEESQRLDPGGGTLLNLALCHERQGRTATAWEEFVEARGAAKAGNRPLRVAFAEAHIAQLEPALSRVVVQVPGPSDVPDLEIKRDGSVVGRAAWGSAVPVDPGDHVIEAAAPGKLSWRQSVVATASDTKTVIIPDLRKAAVDDTLLAGAPAAPRTPPTTAHGPTNEQGDEPSSRTGSSSLTAGAWTALAVGIAGAGVSTYFGMHALSLKNDADRECPGNACSAEGVSQNRDAIRSADVATGAAAVGIVGLGVGTALLIVQATHHASPPAARSSPAPKVGLTGCDVSGGAGYGQLSLLGRW